MCGIIAVLRRPSDRTAPPSDEVVGAMGQVLDRLGDLADGTAVSDLAASADDLARLDAELRGVPGLEAMLTDPGLPGRIEHAAGEISEALEAVEARMDTLVGANEATVEELNHELVRLKDALWAIRRDRLGAARSVASLAGPDTAPAARASLFSLHQALSALDRLEVRGRDSAGIELALWNHALDLGDPATAAELARRREDLFTSGAVHVAGSTLVFAYKAAAEIGELGDNTASLRQAIRTDELLHRALASETVEAAILGHTRWASVGIISEPNAHPQSSVESDRDHGPFVTAVLNGDVDNFADLTSSMGLSIPASITTDAKVIPALMARGLGTEQRGVGAFLETVARLEGSVAIAAHVAERPDHLHLALRGSGQALYIGLADDAFIVASEPYGVVEETSTYLRMDGETPSDPGNPTASRGQVIELDSSRAGSVDGVRRWSYDGTELPVSDAELTSAQITTRDIDRGAYPHYLLKEISDAPGSFRKTLRGKLVERDGRMSVVLGEGTIPPAVRDGLRSGLLTRVLVIGQGTAAVAGQSLAQALDPMLSETPVRVEALPATELSGFRLRPDMSDTLVVAISQSGTTTDTNRTVDLARGRGAQVVSIVNRRQSDLCDKSDGVLYTSDGRDVEMSVASTKAFYAQIAAGLLLAFALAELVPGGRTQEGSDAQSLLRALRDLPDRMDETLARRDTIASAARQFAPSRRYWAIVGNGSNQIAARELRIKLSELCYKSIACDATEDKKHIDLSAEPLILVCAAGLVGSTADDVGKEVAIYRAHKALPIVIASEGDNAFAAASSVITVPSTDSRLSFILSAMAGHLFGYEAALAIDSQARPLRAARATIEAVARRHATGGVDAAALLASAAGELEPPASAYFDGLRSGAYNGHLEASTAVRLASLFRYALGTSPLGSYQVEFGKVGTPGVVLDDLTGALTAAIEELTRPVDAIKHQAKTVTVGISRSDESLLQVPLVAAVLAAGAARDRVSYATLRSLADLDPAVAEVTGSTRYRVEGGIDEASLVVIDRSGIALNLVSRTERDPRLRGTKHLVAREQELMVTRGRSDGRTVLIVPETKDGEATGLTLVHIRLHDRLSAATARNVLQGYRRRFQALRDAVTETEDTFREDLLAEQPTIDLLCEPVLELAERWRV